MVAPLRYWLYNIIYTVLYECYNFVVLGTYVSVFVRRISTSTIQYHWNWNSWFSTTGAGCKLFILLVKVSCSPRIKSIRWVPGMVLIKSKSMLGRDVFVLNHFEPTIIFAGRSIQQCTRRKDMNGVQVREMEPAHKMIETETEHKNTWRLIDSLLDCLWCVTFVVMRVAFFGHGLGVTSAMCQFPWANCPQVWFVEDMSSQKAWQLVGLLPHLVARKSHFVYFSPSYKFKLCFNAIQKQKGCIRSLQYMFFCIHIYIYIYTRICIYIYILILISHII